jgi:hypothetical protein
LSIYDHPGKSCGELARIIVSTGTDRYDPRRRPVLDDFYAPWGVDLHAITCWIGPDGELTSHHYPDRPVVAGLMRDLRRGPPVDRNGIPLRVDLVTLYDREALQPVEVVYADGVELPAISDQYCTNSEGYVIAPSAVKHPSIGDAPHIDSEDGNQILRQSAAAGVEVRYEAFECLSVENAAACAVIKFA